MRWDSTIFQTSITQGSKNLSNVESQEFWKILQMLAELLHPFLFCSRLNTSKKCCCITMRLKDNVLCESKEIEAIERDHIRSLQIANSLTNKTKSLESSIFTLKISNLFIFQIDSSPFPISVKLPAMLAGAPPPLEDVGGLRSWCGKMSMWDEDGSQRHEKVWCQI